MIGQNSQNTQIPNNQITREKQQALLISGYKQAIALLHSTPSRDKGRQILLSILANPDSKDHSLRQLRLSTLLSLAELYRIQKNKLKALFYWYQSTNIQDSFNIWVKMAQTLQELRQDYLTYTLQQRLALNIGQFQIQQQIEHAYKKAIQLSPEQWRQELLNKLLQVYNLHNKKLQADDLSKVINQNLYETLLKNKRNKRQIENHQKSQNKIYDLTSIKKGQNENKLQELRVPLYLIDQYDNIPVWDYMLSLFYALLSLPNRKVTKKHEEVLNKLSKFSIYDTKIVLEVKKPIPAKTAMIDQNGQQQNKNQQNNGFEYYYLEDQIEQIKHNTIVEENVQPANQLPQVYQNDEMSQKFNNFIVDTYKQLNRQKDQGSVVQKSKKNQPTAPNPSNNKTMFENIQEYFKDVSASKNMDLKMLNSFKYIDLHYNQTLNQVERDQSKQFKEKQASPFDEIIAPIVNGVVNTKDKELNVQQSAIQEEVGPTSRERRSTATSFIQTPTSNRKVQQTKYNESFLNKLKQNFIQKIISSDELQFSNILSLVQRQITNLLNLVSETGVSIMPQQDTQSPISSYWKTTAKVLFLIILKISEISNLDFFKQNSPQHKKIARILGYFLIKAFDDQVYASYMGLNNKIKQLWEKINRYFTYLVDRTIYCKTMSKTHYKFQQMQELVQLTQLSIMLNSTHNFVNQTRLAKLSNVYSQLYEIHQKNMAPWEQNFKQLITKPLSTLSYLLSEPSMSQLISFRIRKCKLKQLSQQQCENSNLLTSIDSLFKSQMKSSQIVQSVKNILSSKNSSLILCLKSFGRVVEMVFKSFEQVSGGFGVKYIQNTIKCMQLATLIESLHTKLTQQKKQQHSKQPHPQNSPLASLNSSKSQYNLKLSTLFNLVKVYLLNQLDQHSSSICLRIVFYLIEDSFKNMVEIQKIQKLHNQKQYHQEHAFQAQLEKDMDVCRHYFCGEDIGKIIILLDSLIKMKDSFELRKKFYHRILVKNIPFIYNMYSLSSATDLEFRHQIYKVLSEAFHNKNFKPKKMEDCLSYFLMISRQFANEFDKPVVEFQQKMKRVFNQCFAIFKQNFQDYFKVCGRFKKAIEFFVKFMRKKTNKNQNQDLIKFFTAKTIICQCCQGPYIKNDFNKQRFAKDILFVVAKYLQNKKNTQKAQNQNTSKQDTNETDNVLPVTNKKSQNFIELEDQIEGYYLRYFLLAINTGKAWLHMLRFQITKVYQYFDVLMGQQAAEFAPNQNPLVNTPNPDSPLQCFKHKFKYAKSIASFILKNLHGPQFAQAREYAIYRIYLTNTLKIQERRINYELSILEKNPELIKANYLKYWQGILAVVSQKQNQDSDLQSYFHLPEISFLNFVEYRLPLIHLTNEKSQNQKQLIFSVELALNEGKMIIDQLVNCEHPQQEGIQIEFSSKKFYSKYEISHLKSSLKIQILIAITNLILNSLNYIKVCQNIMSQSASSDQTVKKFYRSQHLTNYSEQKVIQKLDFLTQISSILSNFRPVMESWRNQDVKTDQIEQKHQNRPQKLQFAQKYLFPDYIQSIKQVQDHLLTITSILHSYSAQIASRSRRQSYSRSLFISTLYCSIIFHKLGSRENCLTYIKQISNVKNDDIINFYHHYENQSTQDNSVLSEYYSRDIVYHGVKIEAIKHLLEVYGGKMETLELCLMLIRKLAKLYVCKVQVEKSKDKQKVDENTKKATKEQKPQSDKKQEQKQKQKPEQVEKGKQKKKTKKQAKQTKAKGEKQTKMEKRIKWIYVLFLRGIDIYFDAIVNAVNLKNQRVQQKFEKALLQFKNKLKRESQKEKKKNQQPQGTKSYGARLAAQLQSFIQHYQAKFGLKLRMKAQKKSKQQQQQDQPMNQQANQTNKNVVPKPQRQFVKLEATQNKMIDQNIKQEDEEEEDIEQDSNNQNNEENPENGVKKQGYLQLQVKREEREEYEDMINQDMINQDMYDEQLGLYRPVQQDRDPSFNLKIEEKFDFDDEREDEDSDNP